MKTDKKRVKKIEVFLRQCYYSPCEKIENRGAPHWYDKEKVFNNFKKTINDQLANYTIIYDSHFGKKQNTFLKDETVIEINAGTEAASFVLLLEIIKNKEIDDDTIIYIVEDDYIHKPNWCTALLEAFELPVDLVTLYDHKDKYTDYPGLLSEIFITKSCHWRTIPSTTNTYALKYKTLIEDYEIHEVWSATVNEGVTNDTGKFESLLREGRKLISPIPSYSTHKNMMAPIIDWQGIQNIDKLFDYENFSGT